MCKHEATIGTREAGSADLCPSSALQRDSCGGFDRGDKQLMVQQLMVQQRCDSGCEVCACGGDAAGPAVRWIIRADSRPLRSPHATLTNIHAALSNLVRPASSFWRRLHTQNASTVHSHPRLPILASNLGNGLLQEMLVGSSGQQKNKNDMRSRLLMSTLQMSLLI